MQNFKKQPINQPAFTLIEIIVVVGIFVALMSATVVNYRSGSRQSQLRLAAQGLATNIRLAQSYAIGSKDFVDLDGSDHSGQTPQGGWGINVSLDNPDYYQIVVDLDGDHSKDKVFRTINLPEKISIDKILVDSAEVNSGEIFFKPPEPQTFINSLTNNQIVIILRDQTEATTSQVMVNFFGLVEIE
ncbi:prepilin-type N-terminal cleavage/methylation domain-containing protein [Candidatus Falkowbacteria bacterium]|nr:prepilin-type N-terminal cleavage/methylation domain-containing protein [Candidatus Falkowbacteria bacterium]